MPRPIWKGSISFGMVTIPVGLYSAVQEKDLRFNQIHEECGSRIKLQRFCPKCERVVNLQDLRKGYEVAKGQYVLLEDKDFDDLPVPSKHVVSVEAFIDPVQIPAVYYDTTYYLEPEAIGKKPYALLIQALKSKGVGAIAKIALRDKESLCLLLAQGDGIILETLYYPDEIRQAPEVAIDSVDVGEKERKLAENLVELMEGEFEPERYQDEYRAALLQRIEAKVEGKEIRSAPEQVETQVIDLFEALQASVSEAKSQKRKSG